MARRTGVTIRAELRQQRGLPADPHRAYLESGEEEAKYAARVGGTAASW